MKFTTTLLSLAAAAQAYFTPEKATADDIANQLNLFINQQIPSGPRIVTAMSGKIIDVPMSYQWVTNDATFTGDTQQVFLLFPMNASPIFNICFFFFFFYVSSFMEPTMVRE